MHYIHFIHYIFMLTLLLFNVSVLNLNYKCILCLFIAVHKHIHTHSVLNCDFITFSDLLQDALFVAGGRG